MKPIERVLGLLEGVQKSGEQWVAVCPNHADHEPSLTVGVGDNGGVLLHCFVGCQPLAVARALGLEWADLFERPEALTVERLAAHKKLPAAWLREECGLEDSPRGVRIPYLDERCRVLFKRWRTQLVARKGTYQPRGTKLTMYGRWRLTAMRRQQGRKSLVLVEGESDAWSLWHHGYDALGTPGSGSTGKLLAEHLEGVEQIHVWQEPGAGGREFADGVARRLKRFGWPGEARLIGHEKYKDPSALHVADPAGFRAAFEAVLAAGAPLPEPSPMAAAAAVERQGRKKKKKAVAVPGVVLASSPPKTPDGDAPSSPPPSPPPPPPPPLPPPGYLGLTDLGNAYRLAHRHGADLRHCEVWGKWLVWRGNRWAEDRTQEATRRMVDTVNAIYAEADTAQDAALQEAIRGHARASESYNRITSALSLAQCLPPVPVAPDDMDADPWLFNCADATVDLRTGQVRPPRRCDLSMKESRVRHDPQAACPTWLAFLDRIMAGDRELIDFLQVAVGYSLTAEVSEKCFFFLYGTGDNGKSRFTETLAELLGGYAAKLNVEAILARNNPSGTIPNDLARLPGVRLVSTAEMPENRRLDESKVKDITGNDTISARFMRAEWFDFKPVFKLWMYGNHKPTIRGADAGIWNRVRLIPFTVTIPKAEQDKGLQRKLSAELPGILNWAVEGCLRWQREGLPSPRAVEEATGEYRKEMDVMGEFVEDHCEFGATAGHKVAVGDLYRLYASWCEGRNEHTESQRAFGAKLKTRYAVRQDRGKGGVHEWHGVRLKGATVMLSAGGEDEDDPLKATDAAARQPHRNGADSKMAFLSRFDR